MKYLTLSRILCALIVHQLSSQVYGCSNELIFDHKNKSQVKILKYNSDEALNDLSKIITYLSKNENEDITYIFNEKKPRRLKSIPVLPNKSLLSNELKETLKKGKDDIYHELRIGTKEFLISKNLFLPFICYILNSKTEENNYKTFETLDNIFSQSYSMLKEEMKTMNDETKIETRQIESKNEIYARISLQKFNNRESQWIKSPNIIKISKNTDKGKEEKKYSVYCCHQIDTKNPSNFITNADYILYCENKLLEETSF